MNFALHREVLNRAAFHVTEQAVVSGGGAGDLQVHYRIALSVKGTGVTGGISLTDRRPLLASQINVPGQYRVIARSPAPVHLLRQPRQFAAAADLIDAVHQLGLCDIVRAFPGGFDRQGDGDGLCSGFRFAGEVDAAALFGMAAALKAPGVMVAHRQAVHQAVRILRRHHPVAGLDIQTAAADVRAVRRRVKCEGDGVGRIRGQGDRLLHVPTVYLNGAGGGLIAKARGLPGISPVFQSVGIPGVPVGRKDLAVRLAAVKGKLSLFRRHGEAQVIHRRPDRVKLFVGAVKGDAGLVRVICRFRVSALRPALKGIAIIGKGVFIQGGGPENTLGFGLICPVIRVEDDLIGQRDLKILQPQAVVALVSAAVLAVSNGHCAAGVGIHTRGAAPIGIVPAAAVVCPAVHLVAVILDQKPIVPCL